MAQSLADYLTGAAGDDARRWAAAEAIGHLADAAITVHDTIADAGSRLGGSRHVANAGGDIQKELDVLADWVFLEAARASPIAFYGSEEQDAPVVLGDGSGPLALAIDPLDGSSNIDTNMSIGTIFSLLPVEESHRADPAGAFRQPGSRQVAAGFFIYGPQLLLVVTLGQGTRVFAFSPASRGFAAFREAAAIPEGAREFAINASNARHWDEGVKAYVDGCLAGAQGPRGGDFNMRWTGSMVADGYRILVRGGIFLYPGDARKGYEQGRLRMLYEASPVAFCVEQAGGSATDGVRRILDIVPDGLHARTPLVFGSRGEVAEVARTLAPSAAGVPPPGVHPPGP